MNKQDKTTDQRRRAMSHSLQAESKLQARQPQEALEDAAKAVAIMPQEPRFLLNLGRALTATGQHDEAQPLYDQAVLYASQSQDHEQHLNSLMTRAWAAELTGNYQAAHDDLSAILDVHPDDPATRARRAIVSARMHQHDSAIKDLERALGLKPTLDPDLHSLLGRYHQALAAQHIDQAKSLPDAQYHAQKSLHHLEQAAEANPGNSHATLELIMMLRQMARFDLDEN